jgi:putative transcriptional regulator
MTSPSEPGAAAVSVTLDEVLRERGMTLTELSHRVGITMANLSNLKTGRARAIRFSTLQALCRELQCQPGDLLRYDAGICLNFAVERPS